MEKIIFCFEQVAKDFRVKYYLTENKNGYGTRVEKYNLENKLEESSQINDIFVKSDDAKRFISLISRNLVTPVSLKDVVEDYIVQI